MKYLLSGMLICVCFLSVAQDRITGKTFATRSEVIAQHGMAATSQPLATQVALDILKKGGNAIDAAIAANAVLGLVEPTGNGIGGDLFAIIWDAKTEKLYGLNASGRSPYDLKFRILQTERIRENTVLWPTTSVCSWCRRWLVRNEWKIGTMDMQEILQPAIDYANNGFPVTELIAYYMEIGARNLVRFPGFKETYMPKGRAPIKGEVFKTLV